MYVFSGEIKVINLLILWYTLKKKVFTFLNLGSERVCLCALYKILFMNMSLKNIELFKKEDPHSTGKIDDH